MDANATCNLSQTIKTLVLYACPQEEESVLSVSMAAVPTASRMNGRRHDVGHRRKTGGLRV